MKVAVLMGGRSAEREISLKTGQGVARALRTLGHEMTSVDAADGALLPAGRRGGRRAAGRRGGAAAAAGPGRRRGRRRRCARPTSSTSRCTAPSARTAASRPCSSWRASATPAPACSRARWPWTRSMSKRIFVRRRRADAALDRAPRRRAAGRPRPRGLRRAAGRGQAQRGGLERRAHHRRARGGPRAGLHGGGAPRRRRPDRGVHPGPRADGRGAGRRGAADRRDPSQGRLLRLREQVHEGTHGLLLPGGPAGAAGRAHPRAGAARGAGAGLHRRVAGGLPPAPAGRALVPRSEHHPGDDPDQPRADGGPGGGAVL